jgi:hypothetical protein
MLFDVHGGFDQLSGGGGVRDNPSNDGGLKTGAVSGAKMVHTRRLD